MLELLTDERCADKRRFHRRLAIGVVLTAILMIAAFGKPILIYAAHRAAGQLPEGRYSVSIQFTDLSVRRTDAVRVLILDTATRKGILVKLFRDLEWSHKGKLRRLNSAYGLGGPKMTNMAIREITGLDVQHFVVITIDDAAKMVDALDGIDVVLPCELSYSCKAGGWHYPKGPNHLTGADATHVFRTRKGFGDSSDVARTDLQDLILNAIMERMKSMSISEMRKVARVMAGVQSDLPVADPSEGRPTLLHIGMALKESQIDLCTVPHRYSGPRVQAIQESLTGWRTEIYGRLSSSKNTAIPITYRTDARINTPVVLLSHHAPKEIERRANYEARRLKAAVIRDPYTNGIVVIQKEAQK